MASEVAQTRSRLAANERSPRLGIIDRLLLAVDRLPGPAWVAYLVVGLALAVAGHVAVVLLGVNQPIGFYHDVAMPALIFAWFAWLTHAVNVVARRTFDEFKPALDEPELEDGYRHALTTIDDRWAVVAAIAANVVVSIAYYVGVRPFRDAVNPGVELVSTPLWGLTAAALGVVVLHTINQLRLVSRLSAVARNVDIFKPQPINAFARLTAVGALGLIAFVVAFVLYSPKQPLAYVIQESIVLAIAVGSFVLPLRVMHNRLAAEKARLESASQERLKVMLERIHEAVDANDLSRAEEQRQALNALLAERDVLARLHTWPWSTSTFRGFASALLLPIMLILFTQVIERFIQT
jgi:hypothetical protein